MANFKPLDAPRSVTLKLRYVVAESVLMDEAARTGKLPPSNYQLTIDVEELPLQLRARGVALWSALRANALEERPVLDRIPEDPEEVLVAYEHALEDRRGASLAAQKAHEARQLEEQAEAAAFRDEMQSWVALRGSRRLQLAVERGYPVTGAYVRERAATELPGFTVDVAGDAYWENRANPTLEALDLESEALRVTEFLGQLDVTIVWLETEPSDDWEGEVPGEAIVVGPYLGRYAALKPVKKAERRSSDDDIPF